MTGLLIYLLLLAPALDPDCVLTVQPTVTVTNPLPVPCWIRAWWIPEGETVVLDAGESRAWPLMEPFTVSLYRLPVVTTQPAQTVSQRADFDGDADVDLDDYGAFFACFNGPNRPPKCGA